MSEESKKEGKWKFQEHKNEKKVAEEKVEIAESKAEKKKESSWVKYVMWFLLIIFIGILLYGIILFAIPILLRLSNSFASTSSTTGG